MPDIGEITTEDTAQPATGEQEVTTQSAPEAEATEQVAAQEGVTETTETADKEPPEHFRKGYEALERDVKEKYKPVAEAVDKLGGLAVINALEPLAKVILDPDADPDLVVKTMQEAFLPEHVEALAWSALDNPNVQEIILNDPEVRKNISEKLFNGMSIEDVQAAVAFHETESETDPEKLQLKADLKKIQDAQNAATAQETAKASEARVVEFQKRFFEDTAEEVVKQFSLSPAADASEVEKQMFNDTIEDLRYAAQGRFLANHVKDYMQIADMVSKGLTSQARAAEARLHNKWQAVLIQTAERQNKQLRALVESSKAEQITKAKNIRPDVTAGNAGNQVAKQEAAYDPSDPDFLTKFMEDFKRDLATRA